MKVFIPQYLHKQNRIGFLDADEAGIIVLFIMLLVLIRSPLILIAGIACFFYYRKLKEKYPRGFIKHIPHIWGFKQFKYFPSIFIREFKE
jgi:type IV conjugative transfer system protein TraL